jgi:hypothetical protein
MRPIDTGRDMSIVGDTFMSLPIADSIDSFFSQDFERGNFKKIEIDFGR